MIHERANSVLTDSEVRELEAKEPAQIELIKRSMYVLKKASCFPVTISRSCHICLGVLYRKDRLTLFLRLLRERTFLIGQSLC